MDQPTGYKEEPDKNKSRMIVFLKARPLFLLLLPVFFVLHGFTSCYGLIPAAGAFLLTLIYTGSAVVIAFICWLFYRDLVKASLAASALMGYQFFFGTIQDLSRKYFAGNFISRYSFLLPLSLLLFLLIFTGLKKRKGSFRKTIFFLNILLLLFVALDAGWLISRVVMPRQAPAPTGFATCDSCKKPDVFFIILDEYTSNTALEEKFGHDNSPFEKELQQRGFHIITNGKSNYNYTPFSLASLLNMDYLDLNMKTKGQGNLQYCYQMIRNSRVLQFFQAGGYEFYNYSVFDFPRQPAVSPDDFLPLRTKLITSQTFLSRIRKDILFNIGTGKFNLEKINKKIIYSHLHNNEKFIALTLATAKKEPSPKFVYTHLMMPHHPYYFDRDGKPQPYDSLLERKQVNRQLYVEYLLYCNKKIIDLTDSLLRSSPSPPVIILLGDHGFRYYSAKEDRPYCFMTFGAVYFPDRDYRYFYNGMSAVNLFPVILDTQFGQQLPLRKDSTVYLWE
jgi:hypothetical protein